VGLVALILIHEMGHVVANWYFGLRQSPPIFLGIFGAIIILRQQPPNAKVEAIVGIAGPVAGTLGVLVFWAYAMATGSEMARELAFFASFMNLFNLLPMPPLDGGRAAAAITPWLWVVGGIGLVSFEGLMFVRRQNYSIYNVLIVVWLIYNAWPRIRRTLSSNFAATPYYQVSTGARLAIAGLYALLIVILAPPVVRNLAFFFG
jgi:Zn-dependent protease